MPDCAADISKVDRAFATAAKPARRRSRFGASDFGDIVDVLGRRADGTILPRRLIVSNEAGACVTMLLRRRQLVGVIEVTPSTMWHPGTGLPARIEDDEAGDAALEAAAVAIARLLDAASEVEIRTDFPVPGDETGAEGLTASALTETLAALLPDVCATPDRGALLAGFYDALGQMPRVILAPERRIDLVDGTPAAIRRLFDSIGPGDIRLKPGDAPEFLLFEQGGDDGALTVKVADENRLCLVHAATPDEKAALLDAVRRLKLALDRAAASANDETAE